MTFDLVRRARVASLGVEMEEYVHGSTRARHFHLVSEDANSAFLVAFPTVPRDSSGVAHILEHTTLCGSERFPVRDPFFMMIRRSLATFMNAFTYSDFTAYPFASQCPKDFDNLLDVYLDAVFFPRLDDLDFLQEGWRIEPADPGDPSSPLSLKGVVYSEMKGAMSSPVQRLQQELQSRLFPTTTYHHNHGGEPGEIPGLTLGDLRAFHRRHYHPSNAVFMTFGAAAATVHQRRMEDLALSRFSAIEVDTGIPDERRYPAPIAVEASFPLSDDEDPARKTHHVLGWLLGKGSDAREAMSAHLLGMCLLDNSSSPLRHALETTPLGTAPSVLSGLSDHTREMTFAAGVEGSEPEHADAVEELVMGVLERVADEGFPLRDVEAMIHQLELSQREIGGGGFPYGLQLMLGVLPATLHGGDPLDLLDIDPVLADLRSSARDPGFVKGLARTMLLENPHRVLVTMSPDKGMKARIDREEMALVASLTADLDADGRARVAAQAEALRRRQEAVDDPEILPRVGVADVPSDRRIPTGTLASVLGSPSTLYQAGTNGLVYAQIVADLPPLSGDDIDILPLLASFITEVGCGDRGYVETLSWQATVCGGISARPAVHSRVDDVTALEGSFVMGGKALRRNSGTFADLMIRTMEAARWDETDRLRELVSEVRTHAESDLTERGHVLAMTAAVAGIAPGGALSHRWGGLLGLRRLKDLDAALERDGEVGRFASMLRALGERIGEAGRQSVLIAEEGHVEEVRASFEEAWRAAAGPGPRPDRAAGGSDRGGSGAGRRFSFEEGPREVREAWTTTTMVSFCAKAYPGAPSAHEDAPALAVLGPFLKNGFLHRAIREQGGAYGGGAGWDSETGAFRFYSYRDPRLAETLADFDRSLEWLNEHAHEDRQVEEAVLGVIAEIDRPDSPAGEALRAFHGALSGRTPEERRRFRRRVLDVGLKDLLGVAGKYLRPEVARVAVLTDPSILARSPSLDLEVKQV